MTRAHRDDLTLRREALSARAALQRIQIKASFTRMRTGTVTAKGLGGLALRLASAWVGTRPAGRATPTARARPWMLSAGWLLLSALRASPTARWLVGAGAAGAAVWWVVRALRTPDASEDDSG
jgi:hypothetical protein